MNWIENSRFDNKIRERNIVYYLFVTINRYYITLYQKGTKFT